MAIFYKKTLNCGCVIVALQTSKKNMTSLLGCHNYYHICNKCKLNNSEILQNRLYIMCENDNKISDTNKNDWFNIKLKSKL